MEITRYEKKGYQDLTVPYTFFKQQKPKGLLIVLPGLGYTAQAPLLHYSTGIYLNRGYDVLQINYRYSNPEYDHFTQSELINALNSDPQKIISTIAGNRSYSDFYLIGKSLGTIAVSSFLKLEMFRQAKAIWMTPLLHREDVHAAMLNHTEASLCFIGSEDPYYEEERFSQLNTNPDLSTYCIPKADHSLEIKHDTHGSINILNSIMDQIHSF
ncbi:alpha/beta family hydrolase [Jeotgalibacillus campisalis]|uniref:KANL3/Tex30 alpha/beta hydrolase-like domain-containing protein n=1 Tax=Jeotgalibacillus campisalis TaxID=220754 RepID=A0A0C2VQV8_9BACL|nr:alpha/beta family hydrolase [Jeotgalibacillus campisalis]KIL46373.1 hypothetical protein KR50_30480 [Jeotgalibacillus campisalis]